MLTHVFALALLLVEPASLEDSIAFQQFRELYADFEYERALIRIGDAVADPTLSAEDRAIVFAWQAMTYAQLGDWKETRAALSRALKLDSAVELPPTASPKVRDMLAELRAPANRERPAEASEQAPLAALSTPSTVQTTVASSKPIPWLLTSGSALAALAVASAGVGVGFGVAALLKNDELGKAVSQMEQLQIESSRDQFASTANGLYIAGAASLAVGAALVASSILTHEMQ